MKRGAKLALLAAAALALALFVVLFIVGELDRLGSAEGQSVRAETAVAPSERTRDEVPEASLPESSPPLRSVPSEPAPPAESERAAVEVTDSSGDSIRGLLVDLAGAPVGDVALALTRDPASAVARSNADGSFAIARDARPLTPVCVASGQAWTTLRAGRVDVEHTRVVAAQVGTVAGFVESADGLPIGGARVEVRATFSLGGRPLVELLHASTAVDGSFRIGAVPLGGELMLSTTAVGHRSDVRPVWVTGSGSLHVRLVPRAGPAQVEGVVVIPDDASSEASGSRGERPAGGARVDLGPQRAKVDRDGRFRLSIEHVPADAPLFVTLRGRQPAIVPADEWQLAVARDRPLRLILAAEALAITGRVLDARGEPAAHWQVGLADGTPDGRGGFVEARAVRTGPDGAFAIEGLPRGSFSLWADDGLGGVRRSLPIEAGSSDVVLR